MAQRGAWTPQKVRERIRTSMLARRLQNHVLGRVEMSPTQLRAAEVLLKKTLPDLSAVTHTGTLELVKPEELSDADLANIAIGGSAGTPETPGSETEPDSVH
jgi:hypothetical protein